MKDQAFATEADLCVAFISRITQDRTWTAYAETAGWDILLVAGDGTQIGVQAKLRFNLKVLVQSLPDGWEAVQEEGPDFRSILIPSADATAVSICEALGLGVFDWNRYGGFRPEIDLRFLRAWHYWNPGRRHPLPAFVPDVAAGASSPVQLTRWKIAALRIVARLELRGYITRSDFRGIGIDIRTWIGPRGWLRAQVGDAPGRFVAADLPPFSAQHPVVYPQVLEEERSRLAAAGGRKAA
ncbi:MAG: hypothetical protein J0H00_19760 [Burkholderiales bacterium]|nr:hypothetical protein [Burkholderiales bacterium]